MGTDMVVLVFGSDFAGEVGSVSVQCCGSVFKVLLFKVKNILFMWSVLSKTFPISILESFSFISCVCACVHVCENACVHEHVCA